MSEAVWLILAALSCLLGMCWFALAMKVHWAQIFEAENPLPNSPLLRMLGVVALCVSAVLCLLADHASMAVLVWVLMLTGAGFSVAMILSCRPVFLKWVCPSIFGKR